MPKQKDVPNDIISELGAYRDTAAHLYAAHERIKHYDEQLGTIILRWARRADETADDMSEAWYA